MTPSLRTTILKQFKEVTDEHLAPLAQVIQYYLEGLRLHQDETNQLHQRNPMEFAGTWADMTDEEYDEVMEPYRSSGEWRSRELNSQGSV